MATSRHLRSTQRAATALSAERLAVCSVSGYIARTDSAAGADAPRPDGSERQETMGVRKLEGSIIALVTPFDEDGSVNFAQLEMLLELQIESGTDAILTLGTTGKSATMTDEENNEVVKLVVEHVAGHVPAIAGSGSNCTATQARKSLTY